MTTASNGIFKIETKELTANYYLVAAANGVMNVSPQQPFFTYVRYFSRKAFRLPKHILIAQTTEPSNALHAICIDPRRNSQLGTPEKLNRVHPVPGENATSKILIADDVAAVNYKQEKAGITNDVALGSRKFCLETAIEKMINGSASIGKVRSIPRRVFINVIRPPIDVGRLPRMHHRS